MFTLWAVAVLTSSDAARAQMLPVLLDSGPYELSIDGAGDASASLMEWTITRPTATATVRAAFASVSSSWGFGDPGAGCLEAAGVALTLDEVASDAGGLVFTRYGDVTADLAPILEGLPAGPSAISVVECGGTAVNDGNSLVVVWEDATFPDALVGVQFGSSLANEFAVVTFDTEPIDPTAPGFAVDVGVAITFSLGVGHQLSLVYVDGGLVATDAGGYDDASGSNGGSYTIGGDGDGPGSERWDVTALPDAGDTQIDVQLVGGGDDFWVATWVWAPGVAAPCEQAVGDADDDGFADWCDLCPGFDDALDADRDALPDGCELALGFLSPKSGPASGGAVSTLHGSGLDASCAVAFDDVPAAAVTYLDATTILVEPPAHEPGLVEVSVACSLGEATLLGAYTYTAAPGEGDALPEVLEVTPSAVLTAGGQIVSVRGAGFAFGAVASVDGVPVATELLNPATLTFATPPHAPGPAAVSVANPTGLSDTLHGALAYADEVEPVSGVEEPGAAGSPEPADRSCAVGPSPGPVPLLLLGLAASTRRRRPRP